MALSSTAKTATRSMSHSLDKRWLDDAAFQKLAKPLVAIVRFNADRSPQAHLPQNPAVHFQISIHPEKFSQSRRFIRCDGLKGDEIHGWTRVDLIFVEEILGELQEDEKTVKVLDLREAA